MSKDNNPNVSDLDPVANRTYTDEEKQRLEQEEKEFLNQTPPSQSRARDNILFNDSDTPTSTSSLSALSGNIADNDNGVTDPITEAIRKQILEEQRRLIREHLLAEHKAEPQKNPDLGTYLEDDEKFKEFLRNLNADQSKRDLYDNALKNADLKKQLEATEINGYRNIHSTFSGEKYPGGFKQMSWDGPIQDSTRSQVVKNGVGAEICTLTETTHNTSPITVSHNGKPVTINSYRTIDFPVQLDEKASGIMHLSLVARDKDGNAPSVDKAVYFTAHYEATPPPNGIPKLKEVSSPQPLKFLGEGKEAVGYIEHGGEIYTLPVTRGKYQEMMKEVEINKGQSVDVSQTIAVDQSKTQEQTVTPQQINPAVEKPIETQNIETPKPHQVPPMTPASQPLNPGILQPPQPQKAEFTGIPNPVINAATELSQVMKDLLEQVNKDLKNEVDKAGLIGEVTEKILQDKDVGFAEKQAGINTLSDNILSSKELPEETKVQGIGEILEAVNNNTNLVEAEKAKLLGGIAATVLNADSIGQASKKQILEKVAESALGLNDELARWQAIDGVTDAVIDSNLSNDEKRAILEGLSNKINASGLSNEEKKQLTGGILDKGAEAGILSEEQQKQMQQNLEKNTERQEKEETIAAVQGVLANPAFNTIAKAEEIKKVTTNVLEEPAKAEIKGEIVEGITKIVAESPLDIKDRAVIVESVGKTIATHKTMPSAERATVIAFAEQGVAGSATGLEDKKQMTTELVNGIYNSKESPAISSELTKSVVKGVNQSTAKSEEKNVLAATAQEAILERETQSLTQDLQQAKPDLYSAVKGVADALKDVVDPAIEALEKKEEQVVQETTGILNNISQFIINKAESIRNTLQSSSGFKTAEEKRAESEQQINKLVESYKAIDDKYKPQYEEQKGSYDGAKELEDKKSFIENLKNDTRLEDKEKIKLINVLIQNEADNKRKDTTDNIALLTDSRTKIEEKIANQDKSKVGYDEALKPRADLGLGGSKGGGRTP